MINMEDCWKYIKKNSYPLKNKNGFIGYGYRCKKRSKYYIANKRRSYRDYRKYGFDTSETWSLDYTIISWLSDNAGGFFRECGCPDQWEDIDLEGNVWNIGDNIQNHIQAGTIRRESFQKHLKDFLIASDIVIVDKFIEFVVPRLEYLSNTAHGYPTEFKSFSKWKECMINMKNDLNNKKVSDDFVKYFFCLWD
jgi:hypothetical protein